MTVDIIGAGIGGLTTAIALQQKGIRTRIFEQAENIKPVGAGIILANNAMQMYEKLGLRKIIEDNGNYIASINITKADLNPISKVNLSFFEKKHKVKNIAIHRGVLQQILINELKSNEIHLNHRLKKVKSNDNGYSLTFENGKQIQSSILIGADGLKSVVRQGLFPETIIRNAKQVCWRGVTDFKLPGVYKNELNEAWGKRDRFGFVQIAKDKVYWYALKSFKNDKNEFSVHDIENYFDKYNSVIKSIISSTKKEQINTAEISDLKPTNFWYKEKVCLIGDAAHATTPNMGQGACQAIEDAYILSECLHKYEVDQAFATFQKLRLPKAHQVVKASWMLGKIAHLSNPILIGIRNQLMSMTPSSFNRKQSEHIFQIPNL
ncbi:2-polyprenyl-6-methoxyphenol hydroxylase-like FAD-dependent oxidoreductase [Aquimarina sp. EL_43]|uniref:FAD-dependent monooxygenase n=1 Tax=unclassified Aquimarina TaxID=2627091 RepID=UPI0018CB9749|nr:MULTISPECIES: FAD-dependent monooxygenase [unclassified Aquimarina]MBG6129033.1 2-polyprenyl-6-methoxyphenol hydroxylase-like FAD-dependent oxidoreductase [Aquimarina sp. EL_35]MBG6150097.1 2-polyprenyl-6-methoxyphenol hydroxylase-like FAD-dependent oxidoreductase [Aquimarina sp. EL_32]MBG6167217.1 2-polyprenyl-6-methoxyphenol hydroxylase-like FAD-dependent oxidoreductase [Aquimarina sp. EL_43]